MTETLSYIVARKSRDTRQDGISFSAAYLVMLVVANAALGAYVFRWLWAIPSGRTFSPDSLTLVVALIGSTLTVAALGGSLAIAALNWRRLRGWILAMTCAGFALVPFTMFRLLIAYVCWKHSLRIGG